MTDFAEIPSHSLLSWKSAFNLVASVGLRVGISCDVVRDSSDDVTNG
jgi:hypothetical protein